MQQLVDLTKTEIELTQSGQELTVLFVMTGNDVIDSKITFVHNKPGLHTRINMKFILLDNAKLNLEATVRINRGAGQTDTYLKIDTLLLSENATAHVVPSMEILENEVKGGHGATIGMLDENQLNYLISRGITTDVAEKLLIEGFINNMLENIKDPTIKSRFDQELKKLR